MNYRTGWGGVKQALPRLSCLMTQVQSAPWSFSQKSLPPHPSLPGQVFRCSLQQWKRPLSSQCPQRILWLCRNTQLHIQECHSLLFKNTALCVLCLLVGPWRRYTGAGTTCFLLRSRELGKKKQMEMMWNDSRLIWNWRKSKHYRHEAFWAMRKKHWKEMRGSLVCWSDSPIPTHTFFLMDITVREQIQKDGRDDKVPSHSLIWEKLRSRIFWDTWHKI